MSDTVDEYLNELVKVAAKAEKKKDAPNFKAYSGTDVRLASHIPFGIPSGIPQLDLDLDRPGYPAGRIIELYGFEASGKSCAALAAMAACQRKGGVAVWIDTEFAWDPDWARANGVDPDRVILQEVGTIEEILNAQNEVIKIRRKRGDFDQPLIMVVDSITAVPSGESFAKDFGDVQKIGTDARAIRNGMRKLCIHIAETNVTALYINHLTAKMAAGPFAKQSQSAGGHALKFWSSMRIMFTNMGNVWMGSGDNKKRRGMKVGIVVEKNKVAATSGVKVEAQLLENGFDLYENLFDGFETLGDMQRVNNTTWYFEPMKVQCSRPEWKVVVDEANGIEGAYKWFIKKALSDQAIKVYK